MSEIVKPEPRTREWIEGWRIALDATYMADNLPTRKAREEVHILCDMALNSLDLTTALENARKDALEEAVKRIETEFPPMVPNESADGTFYEGQMYPSAFIIAALRSLTPPKEKAT